jgi:hypothetical protein
VRHVRMLGLWLAAILAVTAVAATTASAGLPEFGKCEAKTGGKYSNSNCTTKAKAGTGTFEWESSLKFTKNQKEFSNGTGETVPSFLTSLYAGCSPSSEKLAKCREGETETKLGPLKIECQEIFDIGEFSSKSSKEVDNIRVKFSGCKLLGSVPCSNTATEGTIETDVLKGTLGYIKKAAPKEVGLDIKPQKGKEFAHFSCEGTSITVGEGTKAEGPAYPPSGGGDGVIGVATPINEKTSVLTQAFTADEETSENVPTKLEGKPIQVLENWLASGASSTKWSPAGETVTVHNSCRSCTGEEGVGEIKA